MPGVRVVRKLLFIGGGVVFALFCFVFHLPAQSRGFSATHHLSAVLFISGTGELVHTAAIGEVSLAEKYFHYHHLRGAVLGGYVGGDISP